VDHHLLQQQLLEEEAEVEADLEAEVVEDLEAEVVVEAHHLLLKQLPLVEVVDCQE